MVLKSDAIVPIGGHFFTHLFENAYTNVKRDLYWCISVEFDGIDYLGESWSIAAGIEWLRFDKNHLPLNKNIVASADSQPMSEASFYLTEHWPAIDWKFSLRPSVEENKWNLEFDLLIDFEGLDNDPVPDLRIKGTTFIDFNGIIVIPDNLDPKPKSEQEASAMVAQYMDFTRDYSCRNEQWRYVFNQK